MYRLDGRILRSIVRPYLCRPNGTGFALIKLVGL